MKYTLLLGDSWGCGEWAGNTITHPGITKYHNNIINLSLGGNSNFNICRQLKEFLSSNIIEIDKIFIVQTEYDRDYVTRHTLAPCTWFEEVNNHTNINHLEIALLTKFYSMLSDIAVNFDIKIHLIGGCSDILSIDDFERDFTNVDVACHSWVNLIMYNTPYVKWGDEVYSWYTTGTHEFIPMLKKNNYDTNTLIANISKGENRQSMLGNNPAYFPENHPNRKGHEVLFDYLKDNSYL